MQNFFEFFKLVPDYLSKNKKIKLHKFMNHKSTKCDTNRGGVGNGTGIGLDIAPGMGLDVGQ